MGAKRIRIDMFLEDVPSAHAWQSCEVSASALPTAIRRGMEEIIARKPVKGHQLKKGRIMFEVLGKDSTKSESEERSD